MTIAEKASLTEALLLPHYVVPTEHLDMRVGSLRYEAHLYDHYPWFQREKIWSYSAKRRYIDSVLRGFPTPEILVVRQEQHFCCLDGQQRLATLLEFLADGFATAREGTHLQDDPCLAPIAPNTRYSRLAPDVRDGFDNYIIRISIVKQLAENQQGALFRRWQQHQSLTLAEKLWTFTSVAHQDAVDLTTHPFWGTMYAGRHARRSTFLASLALLEMERAAGTTNLTAPCVRTMAAGTYDAQITPPLLARVHQRLGEATHLFAGASIHSLKELVVVYQALIMLEKSDCDVAKSQQGCLASWLAQVRQASLHARKTYDTTDLLSKILYSRYQVDFWNEQWPHVRDAEGICLLDRKRIFSKTDRQLVWERQGGLCPGCGQSIDLTDVAHHVLFHAKGGQSTPDNCILTHESCHRSKYHALPLVEWEYVV